MNRIYAITNSQNDGNQELGTIEYVVSRYFWLFRVICPSEHMMQFYISYINRLFDNAFEKLHVQIICYEFPDDITPFSGAMELYINEHYGLDEYTEGETDMPVALDQTLEISSYNHYLFGNIDIMSNCYAVDEVDLIKTGYNVFNSTKIRSEVFLFTKFFTPDIQSEIGAFINKFLQYSSQIHSMGMNGCSPYEMDHILDSRYFPLYQLQNFVKSEMNQEERSDIIL